MPPKKAQDKAKVPTEVTPVDMTQFVTKEGAALEVASYLTDHILSSVDHEIWMRAVEKKI